jgi:hypothetical protein
MITIPTSTANSVLAQVTSQFGDAGTLLLVTLVVGLPLFFWIVDIIIGLFPSRHDKDIERAEATIAETERLLKE